MRTTCITGQFATVKYLQTYASWLISLVQMGLMQANENVCMMNCLVRRVWHADGNVYMGQCKRKLGLCDF